MDPNKEDNSVPTEGANVNKTSPTPPPITPAQPAPAIIQSSPITQTPSSPEGQPLPKKSTGKKIAIIIIAIIAVLLLAGGSIMLVAIRSIQNRAKNVSEQAITNKQEKDESESSDFEQAVSAEYLTDYDDVCKKLATVSNSKAYSEGSPPNVVVLKQSAISDYFTTLSPTFRDSSIKAADYKAPTEVQLVACLTVDETNDVAGVCEAEQKGKKVSLQKTAVIYKLEVYEAKTGKKLGSGSVDGPITDCPLLVYYDQSDPRVYGEPDLVKLETALIDIIN